VRLEAQRGEHYRCGAEYIMYADALNAWNELDLRYDGTLRFEGAERFVQLGLIRDISRFVQPPNTLKQMHGERGGVNPVRLCAWD
jgi:hypothetical protein